MKVVAHVPDLMDRSRVSAAVPGAAFLPTPAALLEAAPGADVVLVDLGRPGAVEALPDLVATGARVVAFGSHVDRATLEAARTAGCQAFPRSELFRKWPDLPDAPGP